MGGESQEQCNYPNHTGFTYHKPKIKNNFPQSGEALGALLALAEDDGLQNSIHFKTIKLGNPDLDFEAVSLLEQNLKPFLDFCPGSPFGPLWIY